MGTFRFRQFEVCNEKSALKVGTDAVLLGAAMGMRGDERAMLDIGTGTGVIALMAAQRCPSARIDAIDIDAPSVEEAASNFALSPWAGRLHAIHSALQQFTPEEEYDLIFSNPPFFEHSLTNPDRRETTARHTESLSYRDILAFAAAHLSPEGRLALVLPHECGADLKRTAASFGLFPCRLLSVRTTAAKPPRRLVAEFSRGKCTPAEDSLVLQDGPSRTAEYSALTSEFYLW